MTQIASQTPTGRYMYAVVPGSCVLGPLPPGVDGHEVTSVAVGGLRVITSAIESRKLRPQRSRLSAHQGVLRAVTAAGDALPMAFGVVADSEAALRAMIATHSGTLSSQLARIGGKVEMAVRVRLDTDNVFALLVEWDAGLRSMRDDLVRAGDSASRDLRIEAGRAFESALSWARDRAVRALLPALEAAADEVIEHDPRTEAQMADLACLVGRGGEGAIERAVESAAGDLDERYLIEIAGPWAPHSFVSMNLHMD